MSNSTPSQLRLYPSAGFTIRADFEGGGLSSDLGPLLLRSVDQQIGLISRLTAAIDGRRHLGYVQHSVRDVLRKSRLPDCHPVLMAAMTAIRYVTTRCPVSVPRMQAV